MEFQSGYAFILLLVVLLLFFNALISREIFNWMPKVSKKVYLLLLIWLIPVLGIFLANKIGNIGWFESNRSKTGGSAVAGGFMEADSVFNPGMKHHIELVEKQKSEIHHEHNQAGDENKSNTK